ncbi:hypothetical protein BJY04DRAFT_213479 [Aspergillus karnatakaensis]|uniref:nuclear transport factor 2 family protein n=1 Tax=Aspergillus karnatakaensis TaxID=1810916 RepID=UPI003CCCF5AC
MQYLNLFSLFSSLTLALAQNTTSTSPPNTTPTVLPFPSLPTLFPPPSTLSPADLIATESIRQTLALYPLAIDGKNFAALSQIFTPDIIANYSAPLGILSPLSNIQEVLSTSLACVTTQHSFGTQVIDILNEDEAVSVTYYQAAHFGTAEGLTNQVATAYGQYQDFWIRVEGGWRVRGRNLVYMSEVVGNMEVFLC